MYERVLEWQKKTLEPGHLETPRTIHNLGNVYRKQGKFVDAEDMLKQALKGQEEALESNHPDILCTTNNLGNAYLHQGSLHHNRGKHAEAYVLYRRALEQYEKALEGYAKTLGPDDKLTIDRIFNMGNLYSAQGKCYRDQGRHAEAEVLLQRAFEYEQKSGGSKRPEPPD